jgi:fructose-6-phosphate aldolase 2
VHGVSLAGSHAVTVSPDILDLLLGHPLTEASVDRFRRDWEKVFGQGTSTLGV